ncbi:MAG: T9SS type A sorting domain-containing protein, partial [Prolixibacteraceae bacterium]|nr:T9SS type A sorting domain-containing protein [Prolixibacteraceae bacterium]
IENNQTYYYNINVNDPDGDFTTVSAPLLPQWLTFSSIKVSTFTGTNAGYLDGPVSSAMFWGPSSVVIDKSGNLFVAEFNNHRIRKITPEGLVSTIAGSGVAGYFDSTGIYAQFNHPSGIAVDDEGNIYVSEEANHSIRKILPDGSVSTLAGDGLAGFKDSTGIYAQFNTPQGIDVDSAGNVYVADYSNNRIRKITKDGIVTTIAGEISGFYDGSVEFAQFRGPADIAIDKDGNILVCDSRNHRIRKISSEGWVSTVTGNSEGGFKDGPQGTALFWYPFGITIDKWGNLIVTDGLNESIRRISPEGITTTLTGWKSPGFKNGTGIEAKFNGVGHPAVDSLGNIYVPELINQKIRKVESFHVLQGNPAENAGIHQVQLKVTDSGGAYSVQEFSITVKDVTPPVALCKSDTILFLDETGIAMLNAETIDNGSYDDNGISSLSIDSTFFSANNSGSPIKITLTVSDNYSNISTCKTTVVVQKTNPESAPVFLSEPVTAVVDTQVYCYQVSTWDANGNSVSVSAPEIPDWLTLANDFPVSHYTGKETSGKINGLLTEAKFNAPNGLLIDRSGNMFVADAYNHCIRKITADGNVETFSGSGIQGYLDGAGTTARFNAPVDLAMDQSGNIYVADIYNHAIRKILPDGTVSTLAGTGTAGFKNGPGITAKFNHPNGITVDSLGNVYVADFINHMIRKIEPDGTTSTFAGSGLSGFINGTVENAKFFYPSDVEIDKDGNLLVVDNGNNCIRKIILGAIVTTVAGSVGAGFIDGKKDSARFDSPIRIVSDSLGNLYVSDYYNFSIRKITADGTVSTLAGNGLPGTKDSTGVFAQFRNAIGIAVGNSGNVFVTDDHRIRKIETLPELKGNASGQAGNHTVQLKVTDSEGLFSFQNFTVNVRELVPPIALCRDTFVFLDSTGIAEISADLIDNGSYDSSGIYSLTIDKQNFYCEDVDSVEVVTLTVTDNYSNVSSCMSQISVFDTIKPIVTTIPDIELNVSLNSAGTGIVYPEIKVWDNCEVSVEQAGGIGTGGIFPVGETTESWKATDKGGNETIMCFKVKISYDNIPYFDSVPDIYVLEDTPSVRIPVENVLIGAENTFDKIEISVKNKSESSLISSYSVDYTNTDTSAFINLFIVPDSNGEEEWSITLSDDEGRYSSREFKLNIEAVNDPPFVVNPLNDLIIFAGEENEFEISSVPGELFDDIDDNGLELTVKLSDGNPVPSWLVGNGDLYLATPALADTGRINIIVMAADSKGLTASDTFEIYIVDRLVGIKEINQIQSGIILFPNPTNGLVSIELNQLIHKDIELFVYDNTGRLVLEKNYSESKNEYFDMSGQIPGIYFVTIKTEEVIFHKKLILIKDH